VSHAGQEARHEQPPSNPRRADRRGAYRRARRREARRLFEEIGGVLDVGAS
jgi:hypothetical protein